MIQYRYRGNDPNHRDNVGLRRAMELRVPLIYLFGMVPGQYLPVYPVLIVTLVRLVQPRKTLSPMLVILLGSVILVRLLQFQKAQYPMLVTLSGMMTLVRLVQFQKAAFPMLVTPAGMVMLVRLVQEAKA